jgi:hypothetical protein
MTPPGAPASASALRWQNIQFGTSPPPVREFADNTERRVRARLFSRWRGLSAVPVWSIGWSPVLYIYTSPSLGRMSASAADRARMPRREFDCCDHSGSRLRRLWLALWLLQVRRRPGRLPEGWRQWASSAGTYSMAAPGMTLILAQIRRWTSRRPGSAWTSTTATSRPSAANRPDQDPALPTWGTHPGPTLATSRPQHQLTYFAKLMAWPPGWLSSREISSARNFQI